MITTSLGLVVDPVVIIIGHPVTAENLVHHRDSHHKDNRDVLSRGSGHRRESGRQEATRHTSSLTVALTKDFFLESFKAELTQKMMKESGDINKRIEDVYK